MPDYEKLTVVKLRDELVARGLPKAGLKAALVQRLIEADAQFEKTESAATEPSKRNQDEDIALRATPWVSQALGKPEGNNNAAADRPRSRNQDEDKLAVTDVGDAVSLQIQAGKVQEDEQTEEQAPNSLTEPSEYVPIFNGTQSEKLSEKKTDNIQEAELQLPTLAEPQIVEVQATEDIAGVWTQTSLTGDEILEDTRKRKRRSQSPPPSSLENTQKKVKANNGRPLVELPEDSTAHCTNQQERPSDDSSLLKPSFAQKSDPSNNGPSYSDGESRLARIMTSATDGQPDAEGKSHPQTDSSTLENLDPMKETIATPTHVKSNDSLMKPSPLDTRFKSLFTAPANLEPASQQSHYPDAEEKSVNPALHPATSALYIRELMRPLKVESLRDHLIALATPPDNAVNPDIVTDFFLDPIRTHCLVGFENISAASRVRSGLHDRVWPNERDRRQLWVDFVPEERLKKWIDIERTASSGRGHPSKRWEVVYEDEQNGIKAYLQEVGSNSGGLRSVKPSRLDAVQGVQVAGPRISGSEPRNTHLRPDSGKGFQALDDLFTSTAAKPKLYYLPVPKAEVDHRLAKLAAGRGGGRSDEMRRFSFEAGSIVDNGPEFGRGGALNDNPSPAPATTEAARFVYNSREEVIKSSYKRGRFEHEMAWTKCNSTLEYEKLDESQLWRGLEFHHFGLILSALFGLISVLMSFYLIWRHCTHYLKPWEQRHIIRVLFMVPIYSVVSFLSYYFYTRAVYFEVLRDCYEAFAIASFFSLLCAYVAPDLHDQKDYFRKIRPRGWVMPLSQFKRCCGGEVGIWRTPRSGLTWFNIIWFGVFQYCFVRVFMTLVAVITQALGRYCLESISPAFAHVWVMVIEGGCVSVAMYCLIQFYIQLRGDLAEHSPLLKVVAIKLVIFLSFWQTLVISSITSTGAIKESARIQTPDIRIGIPSMLLCIEMAIFSVFHLWAFPWKVYDVRRSQIVASESAAGFFPDPKTAYRGGPFGSRALMDAFNPWDIIKAIGRGFKWFLVGRKTRMKDISYKNSAQGTGLEPTRNQITAFETGNHSFDGASRPSHPFVQGGKPGRYQQLSEEEDSDRLLAYPQSNPEVPYPRPMERLPHLNAAGDIGVMGIYDPPTPRAPPYPTTRYLDPAQEYGITEGITDERGLEEQNTGCHGARGRGTPVPPPDSHPLGPPGGRSNESEWSMLDGARENERDLGGGDHGVSDNRF